MITFSLVFKHNEQGFTTIGIEMLPVTCIFDVGKTNKKVFLFDDQYNIVHERSVQLPETLDEDGFPCEDIFLLTNWVKETFRSILLNNDFIVKAVNVSAYGASFVLLDETGDPVSPLYNYLKPYPAELLEEFYGKYGGREQFSLDTCSPSLGNLNSGLQLYRIKYCQPSIWEKTRYALHLPQYLASIFSKEYHAEMTSIGCHTGLWNFSNNDYHDWVYEEGIHGRFPPIVKTDHTIRVNVEDINERLTPVVKADQTITGSILTENDIASFIRKSNDGDTGHNARDVLVGAGIHDSSSALIPYLGNNTDSFMLLSTGTWNISLNPFNHHPLTTKELEQDCLCYYRHDGLPVKASRLFAGNEYEKETAALCEQYGIDQAYFSHLDYQEEESIDGDNGIRAYYQFMQELVAQQVNSSNLVLHDSPVKKIFVDGGFSKNKVFMNLLDKAFKGKEILAASIGQASALGAAMVMDNKCIDPHSLWMQKNTYANAGKKSK